MSRLLILISLLMTISSTAVALDNRAIAVLDIQGTGVPPELLPTLTDVLTVEIADIGLYKVIAGRDIQSMIGFERQKDMLGCTEAACLAEIGGALGVDRIIASHIGMIGSTYVVNIKLINIRSANTEGRAYETVKGEVDALINTVKKSARKLLGRGSKAAIAITGKEGEAVVIKSTADENEKTTSTDNLKVNDIEEAEPAAVAAKRSRKTKAADTTKKPMPVQTVTQQPKSSKGIGVAPWIFWGAGSVATVTGVLYGLKAKSEADVANNVNEPGSQVAAENAPKYATRANILIGAGALLIGGGVAWAILSRNNDSTSTAAITPIITTDGVGLAAFAQF
ncbi:MAG: hypothetical protein JW841_17565 [Deltaproteobacteria bacterium]|nr:hypothetical protein [Deltaproteobacteria bacterium]